MLVYVASVHYNGIDRFGKGAGGGGCRRSENIAATVSFGGQDSLWLILSEQVLYTSSFGTE